MRIARLLFPNQIFKFFISIRPAWISRWQFAQTRIHLSASFLIVFHALVRPRVERPKSFVLAFRWCKSSAQGVFLYPQLMHFPPLYSITIAFNLRLRFTTAFFKYSARSAYVLFSFLVYTFKYTIKPCQLYKNCKKKSGRWKRPPPKLYTLLCAGFQKGTSLPSTGMGWKSA